MNKKNIVSIIVPAYNEEYRISKCLDSLVNQTYGDIEIIVINDGSIDNTASVVKKYNGVKLINVENGGQGRARNIGIEKAKGEYISFVDSDDYVDTNMIEKLMNSLIQNNSDISICNITKIFGNEKKTFTNYSNMTDDPRVNYMISHPGPVGKIFRKDLFTKNKINFLEGVIYEDLGTIPLLGLYTNKISFIEDELYYYVIHENSSMMQTEYSNKLENIYAVMNHLKDKMKNTSYDYVLEYLYIEHLLYSASLRFLDFDCAKEQINKIIKNVKELYPNWIKNFIFKKKSCKFKIYCWLIYHKQYYLCKTLKKISGK